MKRYEVRMTFNGDIVLVVEAENAKQAEERAMSGEWDQADISADYGDNYEIESVKKI